jgi:hypothetical protein
MENVMYMIGVVLGELMVLGLCLLVLAGIVALMMKVVGSIVKSGKGLRQKGGHED